MTEAADTIPLPINKGVPSGPNESPDFSNTKTDSSQILDTAKAVDQKSGPAADEAPDQPVANTTITALDGTLVDNIPVNSTTTTARRRDIPGRFARAAKRNSDYEQVFAGNGTGTDASIQGSAYLTYTLIQPGDTYNVDACLSFCDSVQGCGTYLLFLHLPPLMDCSSLRKSLL
jgi:hypothetical protein